MKQTQTKMNQGSFKTKITHICCTKIWPCKDAKHPTSYSQTNQLDTHTMRLTHKPIWIPLQAPSYLSQTGYSSYQYCMSCFSDGAMLRLNTSV